MAFWISYLFTNPELKSPITQARDRRVRAFAISDLVQLSRRQLESQPGLKAHMYKNENSYTGVHS